MGGCVGGGGGGGGGGGVVGGEHMELPRVLKKEHVEIPGVKFPRVVTQFCRIFRGASLFSLEFLMVK